VNGFVSIKTRHVRGLVHELCFYDIVNVFKHELFCRSCFKVMAFHIRL
jgi:hypothetical protein